MFSSLAWPIKKNQVSLTHTERHGKLEEELRQQREDFISVLKHKLLTPIIANKRTLSLLNDGACGELTKSQHCLLQPLMKNADKLSADVEALIEIYHYQNGIKRLNKQPCSIAYLLSETIERFAGIASQKGLTLKAEFNHPDCLITCDQVEINVLLRHLVDNALNYAKTKVCLSAACLPKKNDVTIRVEDDGIGISVDDVRQLFENFYKESATGQYPPTTGIGLNLCFHIARAHGGSISCASLPGQGAKFTVSLPGNQCANY